MLRISTTSLSPSVITAQLTNICRRYASTSSPPSPIGPEYFDVVVVGGGLVGNAMACDFGAETTLSNVDVECKKIHQ